MSHSAEDCFDKRTNQKTIKDGLVGPMGNRAEAVKHYKKSKNKWKKELKDINEQKKMLFSNSNKSGLRRELKNTKKIRAKGYKKRCDSSSDYSSDNSDPNSSLASNSDWDTYRHTAGSKGMNKLDHVVTDNIRTNKDQLNKAIYNDLTFDTSIFNSSIGTKDPLPVVTFTL